MKVLYILPCGLDEDAFLICTVDGLYSSSMACTVGALVHSVHRGPSHSPSDDEIYISRRPCKYTNAEV